MSASSEHHIVFVHGRGAKPAKDALMALWEDALRLGLERDAPDMLGAYDAASKHMVYYADALADFVEEGYSEVLDLDNRRQSLIELAGRSRSKDFRRKHYESLPGKTPLKEFAMDVSASVGLGGLATRKVMPELDHYWQDESGWAAHAREELVSHLTALMAAASNILIVSHGMGSVLAWDSLWQVSHVKDADGNRITRWITLGSPLAANAVRSRLAGSSEKGARRFPTVLNAWHNIAAEDDYVCHDKTVADDYRDMLNRRVIGDIRDHTIYNLAVRYGRSNPHNSAGYLIHPRTSELLAQWLGQNNGQKEPNPDSS